MQTERIFKIKSWDCSASVVICPSASICYDNGHISSHETPEMGKYLCESFELFTQRPRYDVERVVGNVHQRAHRPLCGRVRLDHIEREAGVDWQLCGKV